MVKKTRRFQPARKKLDEAIGDILDKAVNADSSNAPKQLHLILTSEHPEWKLPERRVAKYLKRQLKARNNMMYKEIDADLDEETVYSTTSNSTWTKNGGKPPATVEEDKPETAPTPAPDPAPKSAAAADEPVVEQKTRAVPVVVVDDGKKESDGEDPALFCDGAGCIIS